jgi:hypothetical protein
VTSRSNATVQQHQPIDLNHANRWNWYRANAGGESLRGLGIFKTFNAQRTDRMRMQDSILTIRMIPVRQLVFS